MKESRVAGSWSSTGLCLMASIVGPTLFLSLFETGSRYLFCFLPVFCSFAGCGFTYIVDAVSTRKAGLGRHSKHNAP